MSYESRVYVIRLSEFDKITIGEIIASVNMGCMKKSFHNLFKTPLDTKVYDHSDLNIREDMYGDRVNYAEIEDVIEYLRLQIKICDYRRLKPLLGLLEGIDKTQWENSKIVAVHYGC